MKITKTRLQQIIREELTRWKSDDSYTVNVTGEHVPAGRAGRKRDNRREMELSQLPAARRGKVYDPNAFDDYDIVDDSELIDDYLDVTGQSEFDDAASGQYTGRSSRYRDEPDEAFDMRESRIRRMQRLKTLINGI